MSDYLPGVLPVMLPGLASAHWDTSTVLWIDAWLSLPAITLAPLLPGGGKAAIGYRGNGPWVARNGVKSELAVKTGAVARKMP